MRPANGSGIDTWHRTPVKNKASSDCRARFNNGNQMNGAGSLGSFPRRREPIPTDLAVTAYGSPPARGRRKPRADHAENGMRPREAGMRGVGAAVLAAVLAPAAPGEGPGGWP